MNEIITEAELPVPAHWLRIVQTETTFQLMTSHDGNAWRLEHEWLKEGMEPLGAEPSEAPALRDVARLVSRIDELRVITSCLQDELMVARRTLAPEVER